MIGRTISTKLKNTATILVERMAIDPLYKKTFVRTKKYQVDDSLGVKLGDIVEIQKCKPVAKNKHWKIIKVVGKNLAEIVEAQQKMAAAEIIAEAMPAGRQVMPEEKTEELSVISPQTEQKTDEKQKKPRQKKGSLKSDS